MALVRSTGRTVLVGALLVVVITPGHEKISVIANIIHFGLYLCEFGLTAENVSAAVGHSMRQTTSYRTVGDVVPRLFAVRTRVLLLLARLLVRLLARLLADIPITLRTDLGGLLRRQPLGRDVEADRLRPREELRAHLGEDEAGEKFP